MQNFKHKKIILAIGVAIFFDALLWAGILANSKIETGFYFLSVGQGDSSLIVLNSGVKILVDGGPSDAIMDELDKILPSTERYIDIVVMTHPQVDHFGGLIGVLKKYQVGAFISSGRLAQGPEYKALINTLAQQDTPYLSLLEGSKIKVKEDIVQVLSPSQEELTSAEPNDTSLVLLVENAGLKGLFTGDIGFNTEQRIAKQYADLGVDVLKVAHHGSKYSSGLEFLQAVNPAVAVIGVGKNNYGQPNQDAVKRIQTFTSKIFRTDHSGTLKITGHAQNFKIKVPK